MGNSESSSQFPPPGDRGNNRRPDRFRANRAEEEEEAASSSSLGTALKVGAAVTGGALLTLGALSLASSSDSAEPNQRRKSRMEEYHEVEGLGGGGGGGGKSGRGYSPADGFRRPRDSYQHFVSEPIKIMSYNVWFREDVEVVERMKAISQLIQQHSPDIIFFQEVTPNIYKIFQGSNWWKTYACSVSPVKAITRRYFCMLLSKLPAKFVCKSFEHSTMGRELCVAEIGIEANRKLVVATSHLESPTPPEMNSTERVTQAKEALSLLDISPNVVFGGDMNWDETLDGPFPLLRGWVDAWTELRPGENGFTFDTKMNPMLRCNYPLQKRLDRFVCKLRDFRMVRVNMIGMEAIPELSWYNKRKVLPVLPSDHYGLLLTISPM